ncbi:hypothetical protein CANCADRAFT_31537 [Tortispora caseinolytica NRRL Y-17796]|uniref:RhoGAP-domain-containing protein n=1 Tax=Tortispora caseinolytica NRRL Y-17796 TaxID=767744 RepID=A0A1E4TFU9_9ASCO|nr:hypothetical protein CANCADRAFT_31537 [Tortispora caseinolytica NRRL Y-17796]
MASVPITEPNSDSSKMNSPSNVAPVCKKCDLPLSEGRAYELGEYRWHLECFKCSSCNSQLDCDTHLLVLGNGSLICSNCSYRCASCNKRIEELAILTGSQAYCSECFVCRNCKSKIENLKYARTSQGIFCMKCHEALLRRRKRKTKQKQERKEVEDVDSQSQQNKSHQIKSQDMKLRRSSSSAANSSISAQTMSRSLSNSISRSRSTRSSNKQLPDIPQLASTSDPSTDDTESVNKSNTDGDFFSMPEDLEVSTAVISSSPVVHSISKPTHLRAYSEQRLSVLQEGLPLKDRSYSDFTPYTHNDTDDYHEPQFTPDIENQETHTLEGPVSSSTPDLQSTTDKSQASHAPPSLSATNSTGITDQSPSFQFPGTHPTTSSSGSSDDTIDADTDANVNSVNSKNANIDVTLHTPQKSHAIADPSSVHSYGLPSVPKDISFNLDEDFAKLLVAQSPSLTHERSRSEHSVINGRRLFESPQVSEDTLKHVGPHDGHYSPRINHSAHASITSNHIRSNSDAANNEHSNHLGSPISSPPLNTQVFSPPRFDSLFRSNRVAVTVEDKINSLQNDLRIAQARIEILEAQLSLSVSSDDMSIQMNKLAQERDQLLSQVHLLQKLADDSPEKSVNLKESNKLKESLSAEIAMLSSSRDELISTISIMQRQKAALGRDIQDLKRQKDGLMDTRNLEPPKGFASRLMGRSSPSVNSDLADSPGMSGKSDLLISSPIHLSEALQEGNLFEPHPIGESSLYSQSPDSFGDYCGLNDSIETKKSGKRFWKFPGHAVAKGLNKVFAGNDFNSDNGAAVPGGYSASGLNITVPLQKSASTDGYKASLSALRSIPNSMSHNSLMGRNLASNALFKQDLVARVAYERTSIPRIVTELIEYIEANALDYEGIYRKGGGKSQMAALEEVYEKDGIPSEQLLMEIPGVTSVLKQYLRQLPNPLICYSAYHDFINCTSGRSEEEKFEAVRTCMALLPPAHQTCLIHLLRHLHKVSEHSDKNLMTVRNLAVVFSPSILRDETGEREITDMGKRTAVIEFLIQNAEALHNTGTLL